jgi:hypothetical protein
VADFGPLAGTSDSFFESPLYGALARVVGRKEFGTAKNFARLMQKFERTRWRDGRVYTWLRVRRQVGRGEGTSGLGFDKLIDMPLKAPS